MKKVLLTGGSGFVGRNVIKTLLEHYPDAEISSFSRSEGSISQLLTECPDKRLNIIMGDIRDPQAVHAALKDKDTVLHIAAMKRVDLCEEECREAASINVIGTMNLLDAFRGKTFIQMSTDKAVEPSNCYGATKLVAERMLLEKARKATGGARFMIIRSGNILGSTGSVMDIWKTQIEKYNEITVTNPDMMRFYTTVEGVAKLYLAVIERGENGKIYFTPSGEPLILRDLIATTLSKYGNDKTKVKIIGLRPGERMAEKMHSTDELDTISNFAETAAKI
jgi:FlaA1/EpsC-like NDP-sugar epimerase